MMEAVVAGETMAMVAVVVVAAVAAAAARVKNLAAQSTIIEVGMPGKRARPATTPSQVIIAIITISMMIAHRKTIMGKRVAMKRKQATFTMRTKTLKSLFCNLTINFSLQ